MIAWIFGLPVVGPFLAGVWAALQVAARICNAIPGAVWAVALVLAAWCWWDAAGDRDTAVTTLGQLRTALAAQKTKAAALLATEIGKNERLTGMLRATLDTQEKQDAESKKTVADLRAALQRNSRAAGGPGLRDPWATRCGRGGGGTQAADPGRAGGGETDPAEASGTLSANFEGLLLQLASDADDINVAYASCRADALNLRAVLKQWAAPP